MAELGWCLAEFVVTIPCQRRGCVCQDLSGEVQGEEGRRKVGQAQEHLEEDVLSQTD